MVLFEQKFCKLVLKNLRRYSIHFHSLSFYLNFINEDDVFIVSGTMSKIEDNENLEFPDHT